MGRNKYHRRFRSVCLFDGGPVCIPYTICYLYEPTEPPSASYANEISWLLSYGALACVCSAKTHEIVGGNTTAPKVITRPHDTGIIVRRAVLLHCHANHDNHAHQTARTWFDEHLAWRDRAAFEPLVLRLYICDQRSLQI
jgi:hypothetical protein